MKRLFTTLLLMSSLCIGTVHATCDTPPPGTVGEDKGNNGNGDNGSNNGGNNGSGNNGSGNNGTGTGNELGSIDIDDLVCPPGPGGRSLIPTVEAYADSFDSRIEVIFNRCLGTATAIIVDSDGYVVAAAECDTSFVDSLWLDMPTQAGFYTLRITAQEYLGEGYFQL